MNNNYGEIPKPFNQYMENNNQIFANSTDDEKINPINIEDIFFIMFICINFY